jgi:2-oxo-4-hydroxy-4-carboxy-5-ureidoimidazoline decarboxylase
MTTLAELNRLDQPGFTAALAHVFEHSPWVAEKTWPRRPFRDVAHLHAELCSSLHAASRERQMELICAHPDLAGRLAQQNQLTAESAKEQVSAGLNRMSADEFAQFQQLNEAYRQKFGFPFIICARLNRRDAILCSMQQRMSHSAAEEHAAALAEIEKIAWLRLEDDLGRP